MPGMWGGDEGRGYQNRGEGREGPRVGEGRATSDVEIRKARGRVRGTEATVPMWVEW